MASVTIGSFHTRHDIWGLTWRLSSGPTKGYSRPGAIIGKMILVHHAFQKAGNTRARSNAWGKYGAVETYCTGNSINVMTITPTDQATQIWDDFSRSSSSGARVIACAHHSACCTLDACVLYFLVTGKAPWRLLVGPVCASY